MNDPSVQTAKKAKRDERKNEKKKANKRTNDPRQWHACKFWMGLKGRFCNMNECPGTIWCGVHLFEVNEKLGGVAPVPVDWKGSDAKDIFEALTKQAAEGVGAKVQEVKLKQKESKGRRIPCPHDPSHTVYEKDVHKHLENCPKYVQKMAMESLPCFSRNINLGVEPAAEEVKAPIEEEDVEEDEQRMLRGDMGEKVKAGLLKELLSKGVDMKVFAEHIGRAYDKHIGDIPVDVLSPDCCKGVLAAADHEAPQGHRLAHGAMRHLEQHCSIVGHMGRRGLLGENQTFIEMGAGKAGLSCTLKAALGGNIRLLVVERAGCRYKADKNFRGEESSGNFRRLRIDIAHLNLAALDFVVQSPPPRSSSDDCTTEKSTRGDIVTIGKHLCGGATDLALRCVIKTLPETAKRLQGVAIATCCHHRCDNLSYVNMDFIKNELSGGEGVGQIQDGGWGIELVSLISSWACCCFAGNRRGVAGDSPQATSGGSKDDMEIGGGLSDDEKEKLGRKCKRLLDWGRVLWLREKGLQAELIHFCGHETSPENCLLLAWKDS